MPGEKVIWQSKPERMPFVLSGIGPGSIFGLFFLSFAFLWTVSAASAGASFEFWLIGIPFILVGLFLVLGNPIAQLLRYRNTLYTITDQRIITQTGTRGIDTRYIEFESIREIYVTVEGTDRLFGTRSVKLSTTSGVVNSDPNNLVTTMSSLRNPYEVQQVVHRVLDDQDKQKGDNFPT